MGHRSKQASKEFTDAFCREASPAPHCEFCGRVHFATGSRNCNEKEDIERLREKAKAEPGVYLEDSENDAIGWGFLDGKAAVWNCPCGILTRYEEWVWSNRGRIAEYLKARTAKLAKEAQRDAELVAALD